MIWLGLLAVTLGALSPLLWVILRPVSSKGRREAALALHRAQMVELDRELAEGKLKRLMELANKLAARFVLIVGENEMAAGRYALKNMSTGEQQSLARDEIVGQALPPATR